MAKKKDRKAALRSQAELEARVKYGGQLSALAQLLADQRSTTSQDVDAARGGGIALSQAVRGAQGPARAGYEEADRSYREASSGLAGELAKLGAAADPYKASAAVETKGEDRRFAAAKARTLSDLAARNVDAAQGAAFAERQARAEGRGEEAKIRDQLVRLTGEAGSFAQSRFGQLDQAQRQRGLTRRGQNITKSGQRQSQANADRTFRRESNKDRGLDYNGRPLPKTPEQRKADLASPEAHAKAQDQIDQAETWIKRLSESKTPSGTIRSMLAAGDTIVVKDSAGKDQKIELPTIPKVYINAAYDIVANGALSSANVNALRRRKLSVKRLGYPTAASRNKSLGSKLADSFGF